MRILNSSVEIRFLSRLKGSLIRDAVAKTIRAHYIGGRCEDIDHLSA